MKLDLIAQLIFAGALTGFLIGPESLDQFIGFFPNNQIWMNVIVGALIGLALGVVASLTKQAE
jgi:uncharacterized membrane protein